MSFVLFVDNVFAFCNSSQKATARQSSSRIRSRRPSFPASSSFSPSSSSFRAYSLTHTRGSKQASSVLAAVCLSQASAPECVTSVVEGGEEACSVGGCRDHRCCGSANTNLSSCGLPGSSGSRYAQLFNVVGALANFSQFC